MQGVRFIAVGDVMVDVVAEGSGHDASVRLRPGGSAPNAAVWAASLGALATVVGRVGDDAAGRLIRTELEARGVRAKLSVDRTAPTGTFVHAGGEILADRGANATLAPEHLPVLEADAVLVSGYLPRPALEAALRSSRARRVALDAARLDRVPPGGTVLIANEATARALGLDPDDAATLRADGYELVVVTRGAAGAVAAFGESIARATPPRRSEGDPLGAGDAFAAALLVGLARGAEPQPALVEACTVAAGAADGAWPA